MDGSVLDKVSLHDPVFQRDHAPTSDASQDQDQAHTQSCRVNRPRTGDLQVEPKQGWRPFTAASSDVNIPGTPSKAILDGRPPDHYVASSEVEVVLAGNWGDSSSTGLTGISLLEAGSRQPVALRPDQLVLGESSPPVGSSPSLAVLLDGVNLTMDAAHMCLWPHPPSSSSSSSEDSQSFPSLVFKLDTPTQLGGLRVWNYNQSTEDSYKGVSAFFVFCFC